MTSEVNGLQAAIKIITLHTFFLSCLMSLGMLFSRPKEPKNQIFFGLFLAFSLMIFYFFLFESNLVGVHPYLSVSCLAGLFLIGPMIYFLGLFSINKSFEFTRKRYMHLLPVLISVVVGLIAVRLYGYEQLSIYFNFFGNRLVFILGFLGIFSFSFYLIITGKMLIKGYLWGPYVIRNEPPALASFIMFDIFSAASITDTLAFYTGRTIFMQLSILLVSVCVILLFLVNLIYPSFNNNIVSVVDKEKQRRSYLSGIDIESLKTRIDKLINIEEVYTDAGLTLKELATLALVTPHQLSEFINDYYNKNFTSFINEFRINKAKELLVKKPEYTILAIAYDAGFNSKSVFNDTFRKVTGLTPSQYKSSLPV
jgi:AraC-like DNA-binding protein